MKTILKSFGTIVLDGHCTLTYAQRLSCFLCFLWLRMLATTRSKSCVCIFRYLIVLCSYFSVILPALLHFGSFIYTAVLCIKSQSMYFKKGMVEKCSWDFALEPFSSTLRPRAFPPRYFLLGPPPGEKQIVTQEAAYRKFPSVKKQVDLSTFISYN